MCHVGAALAIPSPVLTSARLKFLALCLRACSSWALSKRCRFHVALRISRLCKIAVGDLFTASALHSEGWMEMKAAASEWNRRLRTEAAVAMNNVHACQFLQENRDLCKDIDKFQPLRGGSGLGIDHLLLPLH
jgi:hypothetical protein